MARAEEARTVPLLTGLSATTISGQVQHSSAVVTTVIPVDKVAPTLTITAPANNAKVTDVPIMITGKAADAGGISNVTVLFQGGTFPASGTTNWISELDTPAPGTNNFWVWATDKSGNQSKAIKRTVFLSVPSTLTIGIDGAGKVSGVVDQATLDIGRGYRATGLPAAGWIFADWTDGNGIVVGKKPVLDFIMQDSQILVARFVTNVYTHIVGTYRGLYGVDDHSTNFSVGPGKSGMVVVTTTKTGAFSGRVLWRAATYPISGAFYDQQDGTAATDVEIARGTNTPFEVHLVIDTNPKTGGFSGIISSNGHSVTISGQMAKYVTGHPKAGRYNVAVGPLGQDGSAPRGFGIGSVVVGTKGGVTFSLSLPDSTGPLVFQTSLNRDGTFPFYAPRNSGKGLIIGWMAFTNTATADLHGSNVTWIRPASSSTLYPDGFVFSPLPIFGARYPGSTTASGQLGWTSGVIQFSGDSIGGGFGNRLSYNQKFNVLRVTDDNSAKVNVTFNPATGTFGGTFLSPVNGSKQTFQGVVIPRSDHAPIPFGIGYFLNPAESGMVSIGPF